MSTATGDVDPYEIDVEVAMRQALLRLGDAQVALAQASAENAHHFQLGESQSHSTAELRRLFLIVRT